MKKQFLTTAGLLAVIAGVPTLSWATQDDAPPEAKQAEPNEKADADLNAAPDANAAANNADARADAQQAGYLGVLAQPVSIQQGEALGLARGFGLVIVRVAPDSPAGTAGLRANDVITGLNDQQLVNPEQFAVLVRSHAPGDDVTLHVMRDGETIELEAKLGAQDAQQGRLRGNPQHPEREVFPGGWIGEGWGELQEHGLEQAGFPELFERIQQQQDQLQRVMEQMRKQLRLDHDALGQLPKFDGRHNVRSTIKMNDGEHVIQLKRTGDTRQLTVETAEGLVLYEGEMPVDGPVPGLAPEVQEKVDNLIKNNRIDLRFEDAPAKPAQPQA